MLDTATINGCELTAFRKFQVVIYLVDQLI